MSEDKKIDKVLEKLELLEADLKKSQEIKKSKPIYGFNDELFAIRIREIIAICKN